MKKLLLLTTVLLISMTIAVGQTTFHKAYGNTSYFFLYPSGMTKTTKGEYVMVGTTQGSNGMGSETFELVTDSMGVLQYMDGYTIPETDSQGFNVNPTMDGGYVITGYFDNDISGQKACLINNSGHGWTKSYGVNNGNNWNDGSAYYALQTADKGFMAITSGGILKTDSMGVQQWLRSMGNVGVACIKPTADGNYMLLGDSVSGAGVSQKIYMSKITINDTVIWEKYITVASGIFGAGYFEETTDKGFIILGAINNVSCLIKTDSAANYQWAKAYTLPSKLHIVSAIETKDGGFAFAGNDSTSKSSLLFKTTANGNMQWAKAIGDTENITSNVLRLFQDRDKGYVMGGYTSRVGAAGSAGCYLLKTDSTGSNNCFDYIINPTVTGLLSVTTTPAHTTRYSLLGADSTIMYQGDGNAYEDVYCIQVSGINKLAQQNVISFYPNPASIAFTIDANNDDKLRVDLFDVSGKLVLTQNVQGKTTIDISGLPNGIYNACITNSTGVVNKKVVVVK